MPNRKLGKASDQRDAMLRNLTTALLYNGKIVTTVARAKEVATVAQVGIRSSAIEEKENIMPDRIFYAHELHDAKEGNNWMYMVSQKLHDNVYITIDLDVFDPSIMPSTGTPEPDGLFYREVLNFLRLINERHNIIGIDWIVFLHLA